VNIIRTACRYLAAIFSVGLIAGLIGFFGANASYASTTVSPQTSYSAPGNPNNCGLPNLGQQQGQLTTYGQQQVLPSTYGQHRTYGPPTTYGQYHGNCGDKCDMYGQRYDGNYGQDNRCGDHCGIEPYGVGCNKYCPPGGYREPQLTGYGYGNGPMTQIRCPLPVVHIVKPVVSEHFACTSAPRGASNWAYLNGECYLVEFISTSYGYQYGQITDTHHKHHATWRSWSNKEGWSQWYVIV